MVTEFAIFAICFGVFVLALAVGEVASLFFGGIRKDGGV